MHTLHVSACVWGCVNIWKLEVGHECLPPLFSETGLLTEFRAHPFVASQQAIASSVSLSLPQDPMLPPTCLMIRCLNLSITRITKGSLHFHMGAEI